MSPVSAPPRRRTVWVLGLLLALLVAGVASHYASGSPDGLEAVAQRLGFADREQASPAEGSPFAGYETEGVEDARTGRGIAGVAGSLAVLGLAGGLFWLLRRRGGPETG